MPTTADLLTAIQAVPALTVTALEAAFPNGLANGDLGPALTAVQGLPALIVAAAQAAATPTPPAPVEPVSEPVTEL